MRTGKPLPASRFPALLALIVAVSAVLALVYVIIDVSG
jgi:hypothetical protein